MRINQTFERKCRDRNVLIKKARREKFRKVLGFIANRPEYSYSVLSLALCITLCRSGLILCIGLSWLTAPMRPCDVDAKRSHVATFKNIISKNQCSLNSDMGCLPTNPVDAANNKTLPLNTIFLFFISNRPSLDPPSAMIKTGPRISSWR